ncbi:putative membrane protein [Hypnocyclicus thermotrophus]|uniref:Membrane protein n=1 Tax=Hypnocyclicus thermotrophus TaxID=1627895 RepID=A0AA46DXT1_9FUSO|nr:SHOCT domain-containing protein [Hypnocyclicus thermotrophus]TDT68622.1 putative membrane protein [Hypnocyclicus thermotrophus]
MWRFFNGGCYNLFGGQGIMMIIFWIVIVALIFYFINKNGNKEIFKSKTSLEILKERYAKGEITKEEYEKIKKDL